MLASTALVVGYPDDSQVTKGREPVAARPDEHWVAEALATVGRLRAEKAIDLDHVVFGAQGCFTFVLFGGIAHLPMTAAVLTVNRSHAIAVEVERPHARSQGILVSCGGRGDGFVFYVKDNRLSYEYHCAGAVYTIRSDREIPVGTSALRFVFTKTGHLQGTITLYVDDEQVGEAAIPHTLPYLISSEEPEIRRRGPAVMSQSETHGGPFSGTIRLLMISSADNLGPVTGMGSYLFRVE